MKTHIKPKFFDKLFFIQFLMVWSIIVAILTLTDKTIGLVDSFIMIIFGGAILGFIIYPFNHILRIILYRFRKKELVMKTFPKNILVGCSFFLLYGQF